MTRDELQNIICGKGENSNCPLIETVASYIRRSQSTSFMAEDSKYIKGQENKLIIDYSNKNNLIVNDKLNFNFFISQGAEQKVYIKNDRTVYKLNDAIYYSTWTDYLINLLIHNHFFPETAYNLIGFCLIDNILFALVEQVFIKANQLTNLNNVKDFMLANGFVNNRNNDYINHELGLILEDLHDENVLTNDGVLYFIDTVFYIKK